MFKVIVIAVLKLLEINVCVETNVKEVHFIAIATYYRLVKKMLVCLLWSFITDGLRLVGKETNDVKQTRNGFCQSKSDNSLINNNSNNDRRHCKRVSEPSRFDVYGQWRKNERFGTRSVDCTTRNCRTSQLSH